MRGVQRERMTQAKSATTKAEMTKDATTKDARTMQAARVGIRRAIAGVALMTVASASIGGAARAQAASRPPAKTSGASAASTRPKTATATLSDSAREEAAARAFLESDAQYFLRRMSERRATYLRGARWAELGDRCNPGALRVFPKATSVAERDSLQRLVELMERTVVARGVGASLETAEAKSLLRTIVGWEAGIDRPLWDVSDNSRRIAIATGMTGEVPDPKGSGCLPSPMLSDTVTFVIPGFTSMTFPNAPKPRVKAYFGPEAQRHARDEFFAAVGQKDLSAELSYIVVAPVVIWRGWAVVGVSRPREKGGVEVGSDNNGGAAYLMRKVGAEWRLLAIVRSWGG